MPDHRKVIFWVDRPVYTEIGAQNGTKPYPVEIGLLSPDIADVLYKALAAYGVRAELYGPPIDNCIRSTEDTPHGEE